MQDIVIVQLQNQWNSTGIFSGAGFQKSQRCCIGVATGINGQLIMIERTVPSWIGGKAPGWTMLEALVHWQNDQLPRPRQFSMAQQTGDIGFCSRVIAAVPAQDLLNSISHVSPPVDS